MIDHPAIALDHVIAELTEDLIIANAARDVIAAEESRRPPGSAIEQSNIASLGTYTSLPRTQQEEAIQQGVAVPIIQKGPGKRAQTSPDQIVPTQERGIITGNHIN